MDRVEVNPALLQWAPERVGRESPEWHGDEVFHG